MPHSRDIARVQKVNGIRRVRLARLLDTAHRDANALRAEQDAAAAEKEKQQSAFVDARVMLSTNPACPQVLLWQSVCADRVVDAVVQLETVSDSVDVAETEVRHRARAVRNHEIKTNRITDYGRTLKHQEERLTEILAEGDQPTAKPASAR
jgi:hypothetical protein